MRLRRRIATLFLASLSLSTSAVALSTPSPAGAVLPGVIDVAVTIEATPSVVSPPGEYALYQVEASNAGLVSASSSTVTITLADGSFYDDAISTPACSGSGEVVTCPVGELAPGASALFEVAASTPLVPGSASATATIVEHDLLLEPLEYKANNSMTTSVDVQATSGLGAFGLVKGGDSISLIVGDGREYHLTVPASSPGVIVSIVPAEGDGRTCGEDVCDDGFHTDFVPHPYFKAEDVTDPIVTTKTFGPKEPCQGLAAPSGCYLLYFEKTAAATELDEMPQCETAGQAVPAPCLDGMPNRSGPMGAKRVWFDVNMTSDDPLELPPLSLRG